jgi:hypothetical protein
LTSLSAFLLVHLQIPNVTVVTLGASGGAGTVLQITIIVETIATGFATNTFDVIDTVFHKGDVLCQKRMAVLDDNIVPIAAFLNSLWS